MRRMVKYLQAYIASYDVQEGYEDYSDITYIDGVLYGLGASFGYRFGPGFDQWKAKLREHLKP